MVVGADLAELRDLIRRKPFTKVLVNIESEEALLNLADLLTACDGVIVCRPWLMNVREGLYTPALQQQIIADCKRRGKLVFLKGQVFDSLASEESPSYAEMIDLQNIVERR